MNCVCCDGRKIYSMLPHELREIISDYVGYQIGNSLRCDNCSFYYNKLFFDHINQNSKYDFYEEYNDPFDCIITLENLNVIKIHSCSEWEKLKYSNTLLKIENTKMQNKVLIEFTNINWMLCSKLGLIYDDKKVLFEIGYDNDNEIYRRILLFLEQKGFINYISAEIEQHEYIENNSHEIQHDDFVIFNESSDEDYDVGYDNNGYGIQYDIDQYHDFNFGQHVGILS